MADRMDPVAYGPITRSTLSAVIRRSYRVRVRSGLDWSSSSTHSIGRPSSPPFLFCCSMKASLASLCTSPVEASGPVRASVLPTRIGAPEGACAPALGRTRPSETSVLAAVQMSHFASFMGPPPSRLQYDLPGSGTAFDDAMGERGVGEGQHAVDEHAVAAFGSRLQTEPHVGRQHLAEAAVEADLVQIQAPDVERHPAAGMRARGHQPPAAPDGRECLLEQLRVADILEHHVDALVGGDAHHLGG